MSEEEGIFLPTSPITYKPIFLPSCDSQVVVAGRGLVLTPTSASGATREAEMALRGPEIGVKCGRKRLRAAHASVKLSPTCGTLDLGTRVTRVPEEGVSGSVYLSQPCGTLDLGTKEPGVTMSASKTCSTLDLGTRVTRLAEEGVSASVYLSQPCGTLDPGTRVSTGPVSANTEGGVALGGTETEDFTTDIEESLNNEAEKLLEKDRQAGEWRHEGKLASKTSEVEENITEEHFNEDISFSLINEAEKLLHANYPELVMCPGGIGEAELCQEPLLGIDEEPYPGGQCQGAGSSGAKSGSQAFNYIAPSALLETQGIAVPSRLALMKDGASDLKHCGSVVNGAKVVTVPERASDIEHLTLLETHNLALIKNNGLALMKDGATDFKPCGTVSNGTKIVPVPGNNTSANICASQPCGTVSNGLQLASTVPASATNTLMSCGTVTNGTTPPPVPSSSTKHYGTLKLEPQLMEVSGEVNAGTLEHFDTTAKDARKTPPHKTTIIGTHEACGANINTVPQRTISIAGFATIPRGAKLTIAPGHVKNIATRITHTDTSTTPQDTTGTSTTPSTTPGTTTEPKRRRRSRKDADDMEMQRRKARLYEQGPLEDQKEERKRKDAIRARKCREKNREEMERLSREAEEAREGRDRLARELEARKEYERDLLTMLQQELGIVVMPFQMEMPTPAPAATL